MTMIGSCLYLFLALSFLATLTTASVDTVDELIVEDFTGLWYEVYTDDRVSSTFERDTYCVTAFYRERENGFISVHNRDVIGAPNGTVHVSNGAMTNTDPNEPGQFHLRFRGRDEQYGYWVLALGPLDSQGRYSYAITSDPAGELMWVLARNVTEFKEKYDAEVLVLLDDFGFVNGTKQPVASYQGSDCMYEDSTPVTPVSQLSVKQYMGLWYEMYTDNFVDSSWENNTYCQQKNYAIRDAARIGVHNYHTIGSPDGVTSTLTGYMEHNDHLPGEFLLHFPQLGERVMHVWVLALGPVDSDGLYSYAITSDPTGTVMWVLARNVTEFNILYDEEVHTLLETLGFKEGTKQPVASYQGSDCVYEGTDPVDTVDSLDVEKFYGQYFEMYTDNFVASSWERETFCSMVSFSEDTDVPEDIKFHSFKNLLAPNGTSETLDGSMSLPPGASVGQYFLYIPNLLHRTFPYWVMDVGPLDGNGKYSYVIMGGNTGLTMWVLARDVDEFNAMYDSEVHDKLEEMGYKNNRGDRVPVASYQGDDCVYETFETNSDVDDDDEFSHGLGWLIAITIGIFIMAIVMFIKNRPGKAAASAGDEEESVHLVNETTSFTTNPLVKPAAEVQKPSIMVEEEEGDDKL